MPIVINEFEIMVEPPETPRGAGREEQDAPPPPPLLRPEEVVEIMRVQRERMERLRAD